jgi:hypothetical protein
MKWWTEWVWFLVSLLPLYIVIGGISLFFLLGMLLGAT